MSKKILGGLILAGLTYLNSNSDISSRSNNSEIRSRSNNSEIISRNVIKFTNQYNVEGSITLTSEQLELINQGGRLFISEHFISKDKKTGKYIGIINDPITRMTLMKEYQYVDQFKQTGKVRLNQKHIDYLEDGNLILVDKVILVYQKNLSNNKKILRGFVILKSMYELLELGKSIVIESNVFRFTSVNQKDKVLVVSKNARFSADFLTGDENSMEDIIAKNSLLTNNDPSKFEMDSIGKFYFNNVTNLPSKESLDYLLKYSNNLVDTDNNSTSDYLIEEKNSRFGTLNTNLPFQQQQPQSMSINSRSLPDIVLKFMGISANYGEIPKYALPVFINLESVSDLRKFNQAVSDGVINENGIVLSQFKLKQYGLKSLEKGDFSIYKITLGDISAKQKSVRNNEVKIYRDQYFSEQPIDFSRYISKSRDSKRKLKKSENQVYTYFNQYGISYTSVIPNKYIDRINQGNIVFFNNKFFYLDNTNKLTAIFNDAAFKRSQKVIRKYINQFDEESIVYLSSAQNYSLQSSNYLLIKNQIFVIELTPLGRKYLRSFRLTKLMIDLLNAGKTLTIGDSTFRITTKNNKKVLTGMNTSKFLLRKNNNSRSDLPVKDEKRIFRQDAPDITDIYDATVQAPYEYEYPEEGEGEGKPSSKPSGGGSSTNVQIKIEYNVPPITTTVNYQETEGATLNDRVKQSQTPFNQDTVTALDLCESRKVSRNPQNIIQAQSDLSKILYLLARKYKFNTKGVISGNSDMTRYQVAAIILDLISANPEDKKEKELINKLKQDFQKEIVFVETNIKDYLKENDKKRDITTSASASAKLTYGSWGTPDSDPTVDMGGDLDITMSDTSGGISYSATLELDEGGSASSVVGISYAGSGSGLTFSYDDDDMSADKDDTMGDLKIGYSAGSLSVSYDADTADSADSGGLTMSNSSIFNESCSSGGCQDSDLSFNLDDLPYSSIGYDVGDSVIGTTYAAGSLSASYAAGATSGASASGLSVSFAGDYDDDAADWDASVAYAAGSTTVTIAADENDATTISVAYAMGDIKIGYAAYDEDDATTSSIGVSYTAGALTFGASYDSGSGDGTYGDEAETVINASYTSNGVTIAAKATDQDEMEVSASFAF